MHIPILFLYIFAWIFIIFSFIFTPPLRAGAGFSRRKISTFLLFALAFLLGALSLSSSYLLPYSHIRYFTFYKSKPVVIKGTVCDYPRISKNFSRFTLKAEELIWENVVYQVCGKAQVKIFRKEDISYGDRLQLKGKLFKPYQIKGSRFSYREYLKRKHIYSILSVNKDTPIEYFGKGKAGSLKLIAYKIREKSSKILYRYLKPMPARIISAMILGERAAVPAHIQRQFAQTGTIHILAISGLHVGVVAFILQLLLKALGIRRRRRFTLIIFALIFYCFLTGARTSVVRATIMAIVLLLGFLLKREIRISHSLALAALIILIANPRQLFNLGFQLSFVSVICIVYLSPVIRRLFEIAKQLRPAKAQRICRGEKFCSFAAILRFSSNAFSISLAVWLGLFSFILYYFRIISPITIFANIIIVPYMTIVVTLGISLLIIGAILPFLAPLFAASANLSIILLMQIIDFFDKIPYGYFYLAHF
ncbi:MAG: ComEC/Rec2 family competence protein [Candidatus Omnitrophica bacterium]|nr:ComEC/Rec2 family competence protein [Candidatus Omnitrophota bacterium]